MIGYAANHAPDTYRFYNPDTNAVLHSRDVRWEDWHGLPHSAHDLRLFDIKDLPQQATALVPGDDPETSDTPAGRGSTAGTGTGGGTGMGGAGETAPAAPSEPSDDQDQEEEAPAASTVVPDDQDEEENFALPASPAP